MRLKLAAYIASKDWSDKYDEVGEFYEGFAFVMLDGKCGFVNTEGKEVIPLKYDEKEWTQLQALVDTGEYGGTKEEQYKEAHEEFQIWKKKPWD